MMYVSNLHCIQLQLNQFDTFLLELNFDFMFLELIS